MDNIKLSVVILSIILYYDLMSSNVRVQDLEIFITVAECGSTTIAGKKLAMTQPGVSQHISALEQALGKKLFIRKGNRIELNEFGRIVLAETRKIIKKVEELERIGEKKKSITGILKLGVTDSSTLTVIPRALSIFRKKYPNVNIRLDVEDSSGIEHGILRGHYDLGVVTSGHKTHLNLEEVVLYRDRLDVLVSKKHELAKKMELEISDLTSWPLLVYPRNSRTRRLIDDYFVKTHIMPIETMDVFNNTVAVMLAEANIGVAILSEAFINSEMLKHKCSHLRIKGDPLTRDICVARKKTGEFSDAAKTFYEILIGLSKELRTPVRRTNQ